MIKDWWFYSCFTLRIACIWYIYSDSTPNSVIRQVIYIYIYIYIYKKKKLFIAITIRLIAKTVD
jgi:hypothetical protein